MSETISTHKYEADYFELIKKRRTYSAILLGVFVVLMIAGFNVVDSRNAGGFWAGITNIFVFSQEK
jgi:phosphonate transport system permease protein